VDYLPLIERAGGARAVLEQEHGLLADGLHEQAGLQVSAWRDQQIGLLTVRGSDYPANLIAIPERPPLIFVLGDLLPADSRSVAVIGSRRATSDGKLMARAIVGELVDAGYTVNSGLAAGIDTAAHTEALSRGGRTVAVIGTGVLRCYPPQNTGLKRQIAQRGAVLSQFWPEDPPRRENFPLRNGVMSGISLATVVVEASATSGARVQARISLAQGRPVILSESLLTQEWARELSQQPGAHVVAAASEVPALVDRLVAKPLIV
jgi:DNA processing protein